MSTDNITLNFADVVLVRRR